MVSAWLGVYMFGVSGGNWIFFCILVFILFINDLQTMPLFKQKLNTFEKNCVQCPCLYTC